MTLAEKQSAMRERWKRAPYPPLRGLRGEARKKLKRRIAAHVLLTHARLTVNDVANLPRLFKGYSVRDLRIWVEKGMPLA